MHIDLSRISVDLMMFFYTDLVIWSFRNLRVKLLLKCFRRIMQEKYWHATCSCWMQFVLVITCQIGLSILFFSIWLTGLRLEDNYTCCDYKAVYVTVASQIVCIIIHLHFLLPFLVWSSENFTNEWCCGKGCDASVPQWGMFPLKLSLWC